MNKLLPAMLPFTLLTACGGNRDYIPEPGTSAEKMFEQACLECHEIDADGKYSKLPSTAANAGAIAERIQGGSLMMPAFPNIQGEELERLSAYVATLAGPKD